MIKVFPYHLKFKKPFKIASVERTGTDNLYLKFEKDGFEGWGEAVFPPYLLESQVSALERVKGLKWEGSVCEMLKHNREILNNEPSLACAMETCLLNWESAKKGVSLAEYLALDQVVKPTSYTIGISSNHEMAEAINNTPEATYFKLKVNQAEIERIINRYRSLTDLPFVVDANQGFTDFEKAKFWADKLNDFGVAYFEQPFHKEDLESHKRLTQSTNISIIADESFQRFADLEKVNECFDGINVKIIKTGGVLEAKQSLLKARELEMKTILGCMSGSSVSINSASALSSLADYVDLDGVYLISNDPELSKL